MTSDNHIIVRRANLGDIPELTELFDRYRQFYLQESDRNACERFLQERLQRSEAVYFVAQRDTELIGFVTLYPTFSSVQAANAWILNDLYVASDHRRIGAANLLMAAAQSHAKQTNACWVMLQTANDNAPAQSLYRGLGFSLDGDSQYYYWSC